MYSIEKKFHYIFSNMIMKLFVDLRQVAAQTPFCRKALTQLRSVPGHGLIDFVFLMIIEATVHVGTNQVLVVVVRETQVVPPWNRDHCQCK